MPWWSRRCERRSRPCSSSARCAASRSDRRGSRPRALAGAIGATRHQPAALAEAEATLAKLRDALRPELEPDPRASAVAVERRPLEVLDADERLPATFAPLGSSRPDALFLRVAAARI